MAVSPLLRSSATAPQISAIKLIQPLTGNTNMRISVFAAVLLSAISAGGQTTRPDLSTPKSAAFAFAAALEAGDPAGARAVAIVSDPSHADLLDSIVRMYGATGRLRAAAVARWGDEARGIAVTPGMHDPADLRRRIEVSEVKIDGDSAQVFMPAPTHLRRQDGQWRIDIQATFNLTPKQSGDLTTMYGAVIVAADATTIEIQKGKYDQVGEARRAFMGRAVRGFAATQPK